MPKKIPGATVEFNGDISKLKKATLAATKEMRDMDTALKSVNKALKLDPTNVDVLSNKQELLKNAINETATALDQLVSFKNKLDDEAPESRLTKQYADLEKQIAECKGRLSDYSQQLTTLSSKTQALIEKNKKVAETIDKAASKAKYFSAASAALLTASTKQAMDYELAIANVEKVTGELSEDIVEDLKNVATGTNIAFGEISEIASTAATLGVAKENLADFSKTMRDLNVATNGMIAGEEGSKAVARFLNVFGIGADKAQNFGSAITYVGDQFAATGDEILDVATAMSGLSALGTVTQYDVIGLAAEMKNLGIQSQSGASAITRTFLEIEGEVAAAGDSVEIFAKTAGMSAKEFSEVWKTKPVEAFLNFTDGLKTDVFNEIDQAVLNNADSLSNYASVLDLTTQEMKKAWGEDATKVFDTYVEKLGEVDEESENASVILGQVGLSGVRTAQTLLKLAGNGDVVREAISDANKAWDENTTLTEKASKVYETTASEMEGTKEAISQAAAALGNVLLPVVKDGAELVKDLADTFEHSSDSTKKLVKNLLVAGVASYPVIKGFSGTVKATNAVIGAYDKLKKSQNPLIKKSNELLGSFTSVTSGGKALVSVLTGPMGAALAVAAVGAGLGALIKTAIDYRNETHAVIDAVQDQTESLNQLSESAQKNYFSTMMGVDSAVKYVDQIQKLSERLVDSNMNETTRAALMEKIQGQVDLFNRSMGDTIITLDKETGQIFAQGEEIQNLTEYYRNLRLEKKKNAWLDANSETYQDAMTGLQTDTELMSQAAEAYFNVLKNTSDEVLEHFKAGASEGIFKTAEKTLSLTAEQQGELNKLWEATDIYKQSVEAVRGQQELYNQTIRDYEAIAGSSAEEADGLIRMWEQGIPVDKAIGNIDEIKGALDELYAKKQTNQEMIKLVGAGFLSEEDLAKLNTDIEWLEGLLEEKNAKMIEKLSENSGELSNMTNEQVTELLNQLGEASVLEFSGDIDEIATYLKEKFGLELPPAIEDPGHEAIEGVHEEWRSLTLEDKTVTIHVQYAVSGAPAGMGSEFSPYTAGYSAASYSAPMPMMAIPNEAIVYDFGDFVVDDQPASIPYNAPLAAAASNNIITMSSSASRISLFDSLLKNKKIVIDGKNVEFDGLKVGASIDVKNYINGYSQEDGKKIAQDINRQLGKLYKG